MAYRKYSFRSSKAEDLFNFLIEQRRGILKRDYSQIMKQGDHLEWLRNFKQACLMYTLSLESEQTLISEAQKVIIKYMKDIKTPRSINEAVNKDVVLIQGSGTTVSNKIDLLIMCAITANTWNWETEITKDRQLLLVTSSIEILHGRDNSIVCSLNAQQII